MKQISLMKRWVVFCCKVACILLYTTTPAAGIQGKIGCSADAPTFLSVPVSECAEQSQEISAALKNCGYDTIDVTCGIIGSTVSLFVVGDCPGTAGALNQLIQEFRGPHFPEQV